jgi:error-prone DNA polymerase
MALIDNAFASSSHMLNFGWGKFAAYKRLFEERAQRWGVTQKTLDEIWEMTEAFRGYSFCKPHSASFAIVSDKSAYLKAHYPAEFMASVISNQGGFYTTFAYISEAKRMGLRVLLPDINRSEFYYQAEALPSDPSSGDNGTPLLGDSHPPRWKAIRMGFMQIKGLNRKTTDAILEKRDRNGPFRSLQNLLERVSIPEADGTLLINAGALDSLEPQMTRSQIMWTFLAHVRSHSTVVQKRGSTGHLFAFHGTDYLVPPLEAYDYETQLRQEAETLGFLVSTHPLTLYRSRLNGINKKRAPPLGETDFLLYDCSRCHATRFRASGQSAFPAMLPDAILKLNLRCTPFGDTIGVLITN